MANKFSLDGDPIGDVGNESGGTGNVGPGTVNGTDAIKGTDSASSDGTGGVESIAPDLTLAGTVRKRRAGSGRRPLPRDEDGNIIRDPNYTPNASGKKGLDLRNDRAKIKTNIAGLHAMAAVLTKQPILNLNDNEATALTNSLCEVADYHGFNIMSSGGAFGLYASLATCCYMIYVPRLTAIKRLKESEDQGPTPLTPSQAKQRATANAGKMNFGSDNIN